MNKQDKYREIDEKLKAYNKLNRVSKEGYTPGFKPRKNKVTYGKWLKKKLKSMNITQNELGYRMGFKDTVICNKIRLNRFTKMEKYYIKDILSGKIKSSIVKSEYILK